MTEAYDPYEPRTIPKGKKPKGGLAVTVKLSGEMAELGLISAEAHQDTVAIAEAIAEKFDRKTEPEPGTNAVAGAELRQIIEQIEFMQGEIDEINKDKADKFKEAKGRGYDTGAIKTIIRMRRKDRDQRLEEEAILETYMAALGMT